jgi:nucleotide-binding universal stress UspA family protein
MKKLAIKTILVPVDFSKLATSALTTAADLARRFGAPVHLVHVHEFFYPPGPLAPVPLPFEDERENAASRRQRHLRLLATKNGFEAANCHLLTGAPTFNEICHLAKELPADLIVMPTHGYTGMAHFFGGSTAERVVQHAPCPVLVTRESVKSGRARKKLSIKTILVPVDFSEPSRQALIYAIDFAEKFAAHLVLLHVVICHSAFTPEGYAMYDFSTIEQAWRENAEKEIQRLVKSLNFQQVRFETIVTVATPVAEICRMANECGADLVITATHGRTGFKHLLIGSVAEQVVRHAHPPVLVVPSHPAVRQVRLTTKANHSLLRRGAPAPSKRSNGAAVTKPERKLTRNRIPGKRKANRFASHIQAKTGL